MAISAAAKYRCASRELELRRALYPKWVAAGRMEASKAKEELEAMEAIAEDYRKQIQPDLFNPALPRTTDAGPGTQDH